MPDQVGGVRSPVKAFLNQGGYYTGMTHRLNLACGSSYLAGAEEWNVHIYSSLHHIEWTFIIRCSANFAFFCLAKQVGQPLPLPPVRLH